MGEVLYALGVVLLGIAAIVSNDSGSSIKDGVLADAVQSPEANAGESDRPLDENGKPIVKPGEQPRPEDGYKAPKKGPKWDREKHGWKDKHGNVWVPAPTGSGKGHGGGHWNVQGRRGGYTNVYPGGKVRDGHKLIFGIQAVLRC